MADQMVRLDPATYNALAVMAERNDRTLVGQIRHMLKAFEAMNDLSVDTLPHPQDAKPVPVITVEK